VSGRAMSITQNMFAFVALGIEHAMHMRPVIMCGLPRSAVFFPLYLMNGAIFKKKLLNIKMYNSSLSTTFV
jgi:hypothetical protein